MAGVLPVRILLLLVLVLESSGQYYNYHYNYGGYDYGWCPFGINGNCLCEESTVDCTGQGLPAVPVGLPSYVTTLILKDNQISNVDTAQLSSLPLLEYLDLSSNNLHSLPSDLFNLLPFLLQINIANNPWTCDCSLTWLSVWLHESLSRGVQVLDRASTRCIQWPSISMLDVLPADFLPCGAAPALRVVRSVTSPTTTYINISSNWSQVCSSWFQQNDCNKGPAQAGSCVYSPDKRSAGVITYSNFTTQGDAGACRNFCFRSGYSYYAHQNSTYSCLCGQDHTALTCTDCNGSNITSTALTLCAGSYMRVPSALYILHDAAITFTSPVIIQTSVTFTLSGYPSIVNSLTWNFGDGTSITTDKSIVKHTYLYPGLFPLSIKLCGAGVCKKTKVHVKVRKDDVATELQCPRVSEVSAKVNVNLTLINTDSAELKWTRRSADGVVSSVSACESGWILFAGKCIQKAGGSENFRNAQSGCQGHGGNLLALSLLQQVEDLPQVLGLAANESAFIGAQYSRSQYRWSINTPATFLQALNIDRSAGNCLVITTTGLIAADCNSDCDYICQKAAVSCPVGYQLGSGGHCFYASSTALTWDSARLECKSQYAGDLVMLLDSSHTSSVTSTLAFSSPVWIGLSSPDLMGQYIWVDGELPTWSNWYSNTSVALLRASGVHWPCVAITPSGQWLEMDCQMDLPFICEYTLNDKVDVPLHVTVGADLQSDISSVSTLSYYSSTPTGRAGITFVMPGVWFTSSGRLTQVNILMGANVARNIIAIQVLRPTCQSSKAVVMPGCDNNMFAKCGTPASASSCPSLTSCMTGQSPCLLTNTCVDLSTPCSCAGMSSVSVDCSVTDPASDITYMLVGQVLVDIPTTGHSGSLVKVDVSEGMEVQVGDVIGFQSSASSLGFCHNDSFSQWRQTAFTDTGTNWMSMNGTVSLSSHLKLDSQVCSFSIMYSNPVSKALPDSLSYVAYPGHYSFTAKVVGTSSSESCTVDTVQAVGELLWLYPTLTPAIPNSYIAVEAGAVQTLVAMVSSGSPLDVMWSLSTGQSAKVSLSSDCPSTLRGLALCQEPTSQLDSPFLILSPTFSSGSSPVTLTVNVTNTLGGRTLVVEVFTVVAIQGLVLYHSSCADHASCFPTLEVGRGHQFMSEKSAGDVDLYEYRVNGTNQTTSTPSALSYTFPGHGLYMLTVNASNRLENVQASLYVNAKVKANVKRANFLPHSSVYAEVGKDVMLNVSAVINANAELTITWDFGDSSSNSTTAVFTSTTLLVGINHTFADTGTYTVQATLTDAFSVAVNVSGQVIVLTAITQVTLSANPLVSAAGNETSFVAQVSSTSLAKNEFGSITYTFSFGDQSLDLVRTATHQSRSVDHTYNMNGTYNVSVKASNQVSSVTQYINVTVQVCPSKLRLHYDGPKNLTQQLTFTAALDAGSDLTYIFDFADGSSPVSQSDPIAPYTYNASGAYNASVTVRNSVCSAIDYYNVIVMDADTLVLRKINHDLYAAVDSDVEFEADIITIDVRVVAFSWNFGPVVPSIFRGLPTAKYKFDTVGNHTVLLNVSLDSGRVMRNTSTTVTVQQRVGAVTMKAPSLVSFSSAAPSTIVFSAMTVNGTDVYFRWAINNTAITSTGANITQQMGIAGTFNISVTGYNKVSEHGDWAMVLVQHVVENIAITCSNCYNHRYIRTGATDWELHCTYLGTDATTTWTSGTYVITNPVFTNHSLSIVGANTVHLNVSNRVSSQTVSFMLEMQDPITALNVTANESVTHEGSTVQLTVTHSQGSDVQYVWQCGLFIELPSHANIFLYHFPSWGLYNCNVIAQNNVSSQQGSVEVTVLQIITMLGIKNHVPGTTLYVPVSKLPSVEVDCNTKFNVVFTWYVLQAQGVLKTLLGNTLTYIFPSTGSYEINLTAVHAISSKTINVQVEALEEITSLQLTASATTVTVGSTVDLSATIASGTNASFVWYIDNIPLQSFAGQNVSKVFNSPGQIVVKVNVSNPLNSAKTSVTILVQYPIVDLHIVSPFNFSHPYIAQYQQYNFTVTLSQGSDPELKWTIITPNLTTVVYVGSSRVQTFSQIGSYHIDVNASNAVSSKGQSFMVYVQKEISFVRMSVSPNIATTHESVFLQATVNSDANPVTYEWTIEGHTKNEESFIHSFQKAGVYVIRLVAFNNISSKEVTRSMKVQDSISSLQVMECSKVRSSGVPTVLKASAQGTNVTFTWLIQFPNSNKTGSGGNMTITFPAAAHYPVTVWAENEVEHENITCLVHIQDVVSNMAVDIVHPPANYIFTNQNITFLVTGNNLQEVEYTWNFLGHTSSTTSTSTFTATFSMAQTIVLIVEVRNVVSNMTVTITFSVQDLKCNLPSVRPVGATTRSILRSQSVQFDVYINNQGCTEYLSIHTWEVFNVTDCTRTLLSSPIIVRSVEMTNPTLILPARQLPAEYSEFCVRYTLGYRNTPVAEEVFYNLTIFASPLKAIIAGGNERMVDGTSHTLTLDASLSYNPDKPGEAPVGMRYTWNCTNVSTTSTCFSPVTVNSSTLTRMNLSAGTYNISLTVNQPDHLPVTTYQIVKLLVLTPPVLSVGVECVSCEATQQYGISSSHHTALSAHCYNCACPLHYSWSVRQDDSPTHITLGSGDTSTGTNAANLVVLRKTALQDYSSYTFEVTVTCQDGSGSSGSAFITLQPNLPPSNGRCTVTPTTLASLSDTVTVRCSGWVDSDSSSNEPTLLYEVKVEHGGDSYLLYYGTRQTQTMYLAPWPGTGTNAALLVISVLDEAGALTEALRQSVSFSYSSGHNASQQLLSEAQTMLPILMQQGDPVPLLQYAVALTQLLNTASTTATTSPGLQPSEDLLAQTLTRAAITVCVASAVPISSLQQVEQLAYLLDLLTEFSAEYQTSGSHMLLIDTLQSIVKTLNSSVQPGLDRQDFAFQSLLSATYHLMNTVGVQLTSTTTATTSVSTDTVTSTFPELLTMTSDLTQLMQGLDFTSTITEAHKKYVVMQAYSLAETITSIVLESLVMGEDAVTFAVGGVRMEGTRVTVGSLNSYIEQNGCRILLPDSLFAGLSNSDAVLKITMMLETNPFTWGYIDQLSITSRVPTLSFKYPNGSDLAVRDLPDNVELIMFSSDSNNYTISNGSLLDSQHYDPQASIDLSTWTLEAGAKKKLVMDVSTGTSGVSAMHVQIRVHAWPNATDKAGNPIIPSAKIWAYLGVGFEASETEYTEFKEITMADMAPDVDHRQYTFFISAQNFKTDTEYSITLVNRDAKNAVNISAGMYLSSCQYFDETGQVWSASGCTVSDISIPIATMCLCNHLTAFGGSSLVPLSSIRFTDLASLELGLNPATLATISTILVIYIVVVIVCRYLDRADLRRISLVPLCGRDGMFKYHITIMTGRQIGAGTTAHVGIKLYGENGKSEPRHLTKTSGFQRNSCDSFLIATDNELGRLHKLRIWHDNAGSAPCWYLMQIVVRDLQSGQRYVFPASTWLSLQMEDGKLQKEICAADQETLQSFSHVFTTTLSNSWAERHMWLSVVNRPDHNRFTRVQRATCCLTLVYLYMFVNALWYGLLKDQSDAVDDLTWDAFGWEEVIIALVSVAIVFPMALILICIFKRSRSKSDMFTQALRPQSAQTIEIDCDMSRCGGSLRAITPNEDWMTLFERESTTESIPPISSQLRRTAPVNRSSRDVSSGVSSGSSFPGSRGKTVQCIRRTQDLMWCQENILKSWPEKLPSFAEEEKEKLATSNKTASGSTASTKSTTSSTVKATTASMSKSNGSATKTASTPTLKTANAKFSTATDSKPATKTTSFTSNASLDASNGVRRNKSEPANLAKSEASSEGSNTTKLPPKLPASSTSTRKTTSFKTETEADSDEEFQQRLDEIDRELKKSSTKGKGPSFKSSQGSSASTPGLKKRLSTSQGAIDELFDSDDEWTNEGLDLAAKRRAEFNPRQDAQLDRRPSLTSLQRLRAASMHVPSSAGGSTRDGSFLRRDSTFMRRDSTMHSFMMSEKSRTTLSAMLRNRMQVLNPPVEERGCRLPWFCVYVGYAMCVVLSVLSIIMVLLYGYNFGPAIATKWLLSLVLTFLISAFILEPLKVVLMSLFVAIVVRDADKDMESDAIDVQPLVEANEQLKEVKFRPLGGFALLQAQDEGRRKQRLQAMLRQTIAYIMLTAVMLAVANVYFGSALHRSADHIENSVFYSDGLANKSRTFYNIGSSHQEWQEAWWTWTQDVLTPALYRHQLVTDEENPVLLGPARLRQIRGSITNCLTTKVEGIRQCVGQLDFTEDTAAYSIGWNDTTVGNASWVYSSAELLNTGAKFGQSLLYEGGGYIQDLGTSYNQTLSVLQQLKATQWLDRRSRALFVEWTMYSAANDLFSCVTLLLEFPVSGGVLLSHDIITQRLFIYSAGRVDPLYICQVLLLIPTIYLLIQSIMTLCQQRTQFVRQPANWLQLVLTLLCLTCIALYVACVVMATHTFNDFTANKSTFANFEHVAQQHDVLRYLHALVLFLIFIKIAGQVRFIRPLSVYIRTLGAACGKLAGATLIFLILLLTYSQIGYLFLGNFVASYRSFQNSLVTLFGVVRGGQSLSAAYDYQPVFSLFFFSSFYAFVYGLFVALVIAILQDAYKLTRSQMYFKASLEPQDYEMIEFMLKRFKLWAGFTKPKPAFRRVKFEGLPSLPSRDSSSAASSWRPTSQRSTPTPDLIPATSSADALDALIPRWEKLLDLLGTVEAIEKEEQRQVKHVRNAVDHWCTLHTQPQKKRPPHKKCGGPSGKPPVDPNSKFSRFRSNFQTNSNTEQATKGTASVSAAQDKPPAQSSSLTIHSVAEQRHASNQGARVPDRPASDQGARVPDRPASDSQKSRPVPGEVSQNNSLMVAAAPRPGSDSQKQRPSPPDAAASKGDCPNSDIPATRQLAAAPASDNPMKGAKAGTRSTNSASKASGSTGPGFPIKQAVKVKVKKTSTDDSKKQAWDG